MDSTGKVAFFQSGHDARKALELGIQLELIAPGQGDAKKRAADLSHFLAPELSVTGSAGEGKLADDIAVRLGAPSSSSSASSTTTNSSMVSPALLLLSLPVGLGAWLWQRRTRTN